LRRFPVAPLETNMKRHAALALCLGVAACTTAPPDSDSPDQRENVAEAEQAVEPLPTPSEENAIRFLEQATFGPRLANGAATLPIDSIEKVVSVGITQSITNQFNAATVAFDGTTASKTLDAQFFERAIDGQDQLRQRVAFALSQIVVVSQSGLPSPTNNACREGGVSTGAVLEACKPKNAMATYLNALRTNGFGNYKTLLSAVTKTPAMGVWLDMVNNRAFATNGAAIEPNENYARELLQLFTVGLYKLYDTGELQLDCPNGSGVYDGVADAGCTEATGGRPLPAYTEDHVKAFARTLSGWTYAARAPSAVPADDCPTIGKSNPVNYLADMLPCDVNHDRSQQTLLRGVLTTANGTATQHLNQAINNLFLDDNLPPFVVKQLIQHLVTSNPSPEYVQRVVAKFKDSKGDGTGARGDMKTVIRAILEDDEARGPQPPLSQYSKFGHLRSPVLHLTNVVRRLNGTLDTSGTKNPGNKLSVATQTLGQYVTRPPSVFSFYPPNAPLPGDATLLGPEFAILTAATATNRANVTYDLLFTTSYKNAGVTFDTDSLPSDNDELVLWLGRYFLHDSMSSDLQLAVYQAIADHDTQFGTDASDLTRKKKLAVYLTALSPEFSIQR
jgi:uncharacterized protein (DUF1800 family)